MKRQLQVASHLLLQVEKNSEGEQGLLTKVSVANAESCEIPNMRYRIEVVF